MRQLFFISPNGLMPVRKAFEGCPRERANPCHPRDLRTHGWCAEGDNPRQDPIIGVVEIHGYHSRKEAVRLLEAQGILPLPDHQADEKIKPEHYEVLKRHGVQPDHTTAQAMTAVHAISGFPPHIAL
jgi:hypothetical protein